MNVEQLKEIAASGNIQALEGAWLEAMTENAPASEMAAVLEALVAAERLDSAETLGWMLLAEKIEKAPPVEALEAAKLVVAAVPISDQLRHQAAELYHQVYPRHAHLQALLEASGLLSGQSPRRAFRTLDTCLSIHEGSYLANRFDGRVIRIQRYDQAAGEFEAAPPNSPPLRLEPKSLADEFEPVSDTDFRVLAHHRPEELRKLLEDDPSAVLIGICQMAGGEIDSTALKDRLVPTHIPAGQWSDWWSRARAAANRCRHLSLTDRNPIVVTYHPQGVTLEEEMAAAAQAAKTPMEHLAVLRQYARQARERKLRIDPKFAAAVTGLLVNQANAFKARRPVDALAASLALQFAAELGLAIEGQFPSPQEILASAAHPDQVVAQIDDASLLPAALDALAARPDAAAQLEALLYLAPASELDEVAQRSTIADGGEGLTRATAAALADPRKHLELFLWLWKGPAKPPPNLPGKVELLGRLLTSLQDMENDWEAPSAKRKAFHQRIRNAISAADYASFRQAAAEMNEGVAATVKRALERTEGLAEAVQAETMNILRERFFNLFVKTRIEPWLDDNALWTTEKSLHRRQDELKELTEVKMLANSRAIGAAAARGDLSENAEWKFAVEERNLLQARAAKIQEELAKARVIRPENMPANSVGIGSKVLLRRMSDGQEIELGFLGPWDSDPENRVYAYQTPLALDLMGKRLGEVLRLKIDGREDEYCIEKLSPAV